MAKVDPIEPGTMMGDYLVEGKLDEGGMGTVYRAVHPIIGKKAAIKVLHPHVATQETSVARFIQEARAVNAIRHPGIVDIFGFGRHTDGRHYIIMEFLEGEHLLSYLDRNGPLKPKQVCQLVRRIAEPLSAAHAHGVIHRDLKPENVFLLHPIEGRWPPRIKLLDFGLAKLIEKQFQSGPQTRTGSTVGTPYYMAPEQCRGRTVDARTDIYALGVMMYELLTGRVPFYAEAAVDVLYMHLNEEPEPPSRFVSVPKGLERLILDCLQKPADLRPASISVLVARLDAVEREMEESFSAHVSFEDLVVQTAEILTGGSPSETDTAASAPGPSGASTSGPVGASAEPEAGEASAKAPVQEPEPSTASAGPQAQLAAGAREQPAQAAPAGMDPTAWAKEELTQPVELPGPGAGARTMPAWYFLVGLVVGLAAGALVAYLLVR